MPLSEEEELEYLRLKQKMGGPDLPSPGIGTGMTRSALQGMTFGFSALVSTSGTAFLKPKKER